MERAIRDVLGARGAQEAREAREAQVGCEVTGSAAGLRAPRLERYLRANFGPGGGAAREAMGLMCALVGQVQMLTNTLAPLAFGFELLRAQALGTQASAYAAVYRRIAQRAQKLTLQDAEEETVLLTKDALGFGRTAPQDTRNIEELPPAKQMECFGRAFSDETELAQYVNSLAQRHAYLKAELGAWDEVFREGKTAFEKLATKETLPEVEKASDIATLLEASAAVQAALALESQQAFKRWLERVSRVESRELCQVLEGARFPSEIAKPVADCLVSALCDQGQLLREVAPDPGLYNPRRFMGDLIKLLGERVGPQIADAQEEYRKALRAKVAGALVGQKERLGPEKFTATVLAMQTKVKGAKSLHQLLEAVGFGLGEHQNSDNSVEECAKDVNQNETQTQNKHTEALIATLLWIDGDADALLT